jgi:hypothetical protein
MRVLLLLLLLWPQAGMAKAQESDQAAAPVQTGVLDQENMRALFPATVYFSGQNATVQFRNSGGVRWSEGKQTLFAMVDAGGYSSGMREKYQFYILTDVPIEIGGKRLAPGAYGAGFLNDGLLVMDLGGTELFHASVQRDAGMQRPRPLQVVAGATSARYRLYLGRDFVEFSMVR